MCWRHGAQKKRWIANVHGYFGEAESLLLTLAAVGLFDVPCMTESAWMHICIDSPLLQWMLSWLEPTSCTFLHIHLLMFKLVYRVHINITLSLLLKGKREQLDLDRCRKYHTSISYHNINSLCSVHLPMREDEDALRKFAQLHRFF